MNTVRDALQQAVTALGDHNGARLEAEVLLARVLGRDRTFLLAWPERRLGAELRQSYQALLDRRAGGEPVAYLIGEREFWSMDLEVTPATLIPRPETERLVELALGRLSSEPRTVADLGTGSGAVALALARERPHWRIIATDISAAALEVARRNAARHRIGNVEFRRGDWLDGLTGARCDLIVSNPPYVAEDDPHMQSGDVRFEPHGALAAGPEGLDAIRRISEDAAQYLSPDGWLMIEHGFDQGTAVRHLLAGEGYAEVTTYRDLAGRERVTACRRGDPPP